MIFFDIVDRGGANVVGGASSSSVFTKFTSDFGNVGYICGFTYVQWVMYSGFLLAADAIGRPTRLGAVSC